MFVWFGLVLACVWMSFPADAVYFHIGETETKCFLEEVPAETIVSGIYNVELFDSRTNRFSPPGPEIGMHVEVQDPEQKVILSRVYSNKGKFIFTSSDPGEHSVCLRSNSTKWFSGAQLRVHLDIKVGEEAVDYAKVAEADKLTTLQLRIRQLLDHVEQIGKEQSYQRYREEKFRETSESTNRRVLWWALIQTALLLAMGYWQMRHLRSFFTAKKLV